MFNSNMFKQQLTMVISRGYISLKLILDQQVHLRKPFICGIHLCLQTNTKVKRLEDLKKPDLALLIKIR